MTLRERLMTVLRGQEADRIPWNIYGWILPDSEAGRRLHAKGLSKMGSSRIWRDVYGDGIKLSETRGEREGAPWIVRQIETPVGTISEESTIDPSYGSNWVKKHFIGGPDDYRAAEYFLRHTQAEPTYDDWHRADAAMGEGGIVIGEIVPVSIVQAMVAWTGAEQLAEGMYIYPDQFESFIDALNQQYYRHIEIAAASPCEVIWFPDNVTGTIVSPRSFERYCAPLYAHSMPIMRQAGKIPIAHYDGSNRPLVDSLARTDLPVIEAFTPPPMGDLSVAEAKAAWPEKVIWVNFPGNYFLEPADVIEQYTLDLLRESAPGGRLVIGCTEDYPYSEFDKTFSAIGKAMAEYEGYEW